MVAAWFPVLPPVPGQQWDEQRQDHHLVQPILEDLEHLDGEDRGDREHQQPDDATAHDAQDRRGEVGARQRFGAAGAGGILGVLTLDDVHGVIDGHDPDQPPFAVHNGHGQQLRREEAARGILSVIGRGRADRHVGDIAHERIAVGHQQAAQPHHAQQQAGIIHHGQQVDRLGLLGLRAHMLERLSR